MTTGNVNLGMASIVDTGQWRLTIEIEDSRIYAVLVNVEYEDVPPILLLDDSWEGRTENRLSLVESALYDNPRLLDDFATHIIIKEPKSLWIPTELTEDEEFDYSFFTSVYPASPDDICAGFGERDTCIFLPVSGLKSFLHRTLPGSRISCHISVLKDSFEALESQSDAADADGSVYLSVQPGFVDIFAFQKGRFLCGASQEWRATSDIAYKAVLAAHAYGLDLEHTRLIIRADHSKVQEIRTLINDFFKEILSLRLPEGHEALNMPFACSLAIGVQPHFVSESCV